MHFQSTYKFVLSTTYEKKDNATVRVKMTGKSGNEVFSDVYLLDKSLDKSIIEIDVSI